MKKVAIIFGVILGLLVVSAWAIPTFFKDDILAAVQTKLNEQLDATVSLNPDKFSLSLFSNFPSLTIQVGDLAIVGKGDFEGDTLIAAEQLNVEANLKSVLFGDNIEVGGIKVTKPTMLVKVLPNGKANYDIYIADSTAEVSSVDTASSDFALSINHWEIEDGNIVYEDQTLPMSMKLVQLNHTGSGNISSTQYDLETKTTIEQTSVIFDNVGYLNKTNIDADLILGIDMAESKYTFKEGSVKLNDFVLKTDGFVQLFGDSLQNTRMDLTFSSEESSFKSLLSLIPAMFLKDFEELEARGELKFNGMAKGELTATQMPGFAVDMTVKDGYFKYPDLPSAVKDVQVNMSVDAKDGDMNNLAIDIPNFSLNLGNNPISGKVSLKGLEEMMVNADVKGKVNLAEMLEVFPVDSLEMKGVFSLDLKANGLYSEAKNSIPKIDANMKLEEGYVKSLSYPYPVENLHVVANAKNETGNMSDFKFTISDASLLMHNEPLSAKGTLYDLDNPTYDFNMKGKFDLAAVSKIVDLGDMSLVGKIDAEIHTKGDMKAIEAEQYDKLPTSGSISVSNIAYKSTDLPQGLTIKNARMTFTPQEIKIQNYVGTVGTSDVEVKGSLTNYLAYIMKASEPLRGTMTVNSQKFNVNEWMVDESGNPTADAPSTTGEDTEEYGVIAVPKDIDFNMNANATTVVYENFTLKNLKGNVRIKDGIVDLTSVNFGMLGGNITANGSYDPTDLQKPKFDMGLDIQSMKIQEAYKNIVSIKALAPIAKNLEGIFGTKMRLSGVLGQDFMPILSTLSGGGDVSVQDATMNGVPLFSKIAQFTGVSNLGESKQLKDIIINTTIKDGKINIKPFDLKISDYQATVGGDAGLDGSMDYVMKIDLPLNKLNMSWAKQYQALTGEQTIPLNLNIGGLYNSPSVGLDKSQGEEVKTVIATKLKEKGKDALKDKLGGLLNRGTSDSTKTKSDSTKTVNPLDKLKDKFPFKKKN
jgi:hypothetical protein